ncbi:MAG: M48 family metallopeptidase [Acidobacteria bacterium]|nr:M48 family metallopeptidase [Acidobacteriota bacterium]
MDDSLRAKRYHRAGRILGVAAYALDLALLFLLIFAGWTTGLRTFAEQATSHPTLALLIYFIILGLIFELLGFPLSYLRGYWLEHRYGLSNLTFWAWVKDQLKGLVVGGTLAILGVELIYWTMRKWPDTWWVISASAFVAFFILLSNLAPVLLFPIFFKFKPIEDADLTNQLMELSRRAGMHVRGVFEWRLSEKSKKANAALVGLGNTRRIILSDTLLEKFSPDEVEAVLAHEFGHHVRHHIFRAIIIQTLTTYLGFYLANLCLLKWGPLLGFEGVADFANLPLLILVSMGLSLILLPCINGHSRWLERQADAYALKRIQSKSAFIASMEKLADINLAERRPSAWIEFIFHSHPSIEKRIANARNAAE